jgi:nicotinamidase/pyrazinamidase
MLDSEILAHSALVVVDIQNDFCPGGALAVPGGDEIVPLVNSLMTRFTHIVLTQDWHPQGHCSFASSQGVAPFSFDQRNPSQGILWPDHCVAGTFGAEFHPSLRADRANLILRKGTRAGLDSYSAFFENDGATPTGLFGWLNELGLSRMYVLGLATDYCVKATAIDAARLGLEVAVVPQASRPVAVSPKDEEAALDAMRSAGCVMVSLTEFRS